MHSQLLGLAMIVTSFFINIHLRAQVIEKESVPIAKLALTVSVWDRYHNKSGSVFHDEPVVQTDLALCDLALPLLLQLPKARLDLVFQYDF